MKVYVKKLRKLIFTIIWALPRLVKTTFVTCFYPSGSGCSLYLLFHCIAQKDATAIPNAVKCFKCGF